MTHIEIIEKLIGPIKPVGESHTDSERFENLKVYCELFEDMKQTLQDICDTNASMREASIIKAVKHIEQYL